MIFELWNCVADPSLSLLSCLNGPMLALWGPFILLLMCAFGLPFPEDIILVVAGVLSAKYGHSIILTMVVTYFGIMIGDSIIFLIGKNFGDRALRTRFGKKILKEERLELASQKFNKYGNGILFAGRFMPGLRTIIFFTSGTLKTPYYKFALMDGVAALISAPLFVYLGHWAFGKYDANFDKVKEAVFQLKSSLIIYGGIAFAVAGLSFLIYWVFFRKPKIPKA